MRTSATAAVRAVAAAAGRAAREGAGAAGARGAAGPRGAAKPTGGPTRTINGTVAGVLAVWAHLYWAAVTRAPSTLQALVLTLTAGLTLYLYLLIVFLDPGPIPPAYAAGVAEEGGGSGTGAAPSAPTSPSPLHPQPSVVEVKRKGGGARICTKCGGAPKPPRAHHCRTCGRCVARMDHHCRWANNCVGAGTARAFLQLMVWAPSSSGHAAWVVGTHLRTRLASSAGAAALDVLTALLGAVTAASLAYLAAWHVRLLLEGKTTLEHFEGVTARVAPGAAAAAAAAAARAAAAPVAHPYDRGPWENVAAVLGPDPARWLIPPDPRAPQRGSAVAVGGGVAFATAFDGPAAAAAVAAAAARWLGPDAAAAFGLAASPALARGDGAASSAAPSAGPAPAASGEAALAAAAAAVASAVASGGGGRVRED